MIHTVFTREKVQGVLDRLGESDKYRIERCENNSVIIRRNDEPRLAVVGARFFDVTENELENWVASLLKMADDEIAKRNQP